MDQGEYIRAMRDEGWALWGRNSGYLSFVCCRVGCTAARLITDERIRNGDVQRPCRLPHEGGYSADVVRSHDELRSHLRDRRLALGLSQADVEAAAGLTKDHLAKMETRRRLVQFPTYFAWAETLGFDIALIPKALPDQTIAIIQDRANQGSSSRRLPGCLRLPAVRAAS